VRYVEPLRLSRDDAEVQLNSENIQVVCQALVAIAFHEESWEWAQSQCLRLSEHPSAEVRGLVATCLGHIARIHGRLDLERVMPVLERLRNEDEISGQVEAALDDISMFLDQ
jgi:hypothetical protein